MQPLDTDNPPPVDSREQQPITLAGLDVEHHGGSVDVDDPRLADNLVSLEGSSHVGHVHGHSHRHLVVIDVPTQEFQRGLLDVPHQPWSREDGIEFSRAEADEILGADGKPSLTGP